MTTVVGTFHPETNTIVTGPIKLWIQILTDRSPADGVPSNAEHGVAVNFFNAYSSATAAPAEANQLSASAAAASA